MASWVLIPALKSLFEAFDRIAPNRDKASDGAVGDTAHSQTSSDHNPDETGNVPIHDADKINEVHAIDVDNNLNESDLTMEKVVQFLLSRCRSGAEKRLRYIIYNKRIWSASSGWVQKTYTGKSPHTEHAHFSGSYTTSLEASTASWHLEDIPVSMTAADKEWFSKEIRAVVDDRMTSYAKAVNETFRFDWSKLPGSEYKRNLGDLVGDPWFAVMAGTTRGGDPLPEAGVFGQLLNEIRDLRAKVDALTPKE